MELAPQDHSLGRRVSSKVAAGLILSNILSGTDRWLVMQIWSVSGLSGRG